MGGEASIARIASGASRNRQSLQDWSRAGARTPGIHLRWLPGARVEFPYREPHDGGRIRDRGTTSDGRCGESALQRMSVEADGGRGGLVSWRIGVMVNRDRGGSASWRIGGVVDGCRRRWVALSMDGVADRWRRRSVALSIGPVVDRVASSIGAVAEWAAGGQLFSGLGGAGISFPPMVASPSRSTTPMA